MLLTVSGALLSLSILTAGRFCWWEVTNQAAAKNASTTGSSRLRTGGLTLALKGSQPRNRARDRGK